MPEVLGTALGDINVWLFTAAGLLILIIGCQAALNLWFMIRSLSVTQNTAELAALTAEMRRRMDTMHMDIGKLETGMGSRLDGAISILERLVVPGDKK